MSTGIRATLAIHFYCCLHCSADVNFNSLLKDFVNLIGTVVDIRPGRWISGLYMLARTLHFTHKLQTIEICLISVCDIITGCQFCLSITLTIVLVFQATGSVESATSREESLTTSTNSSKGQASPVKLAVVGKRKQSPISLRFNVSDGTEV